MAGFDLALGYGQWQGSGRAENLSRGAKAAAAACARFAPLETVPVAARHGAETPEARWQAIADQFDAAQALLAERAPHRLLTAGGDCAVDLAPIRYLAGRYSDLNVLWIDAHMDANTPETSPSGNFHGMIVAALLGRVPAAVAPQRGAPLQAKQIHYYGVTAADDGDRALQDELGMVVYDTPPTLTGPVHIHFDLDVLDPVEFPYLAYRDGKLRVADTIALLQRTAQAADIVGLTFTEFAPANDHDARAGAEIITRLCEAASANQGTIEWPA